jgi:hypothetical protein
MAAPSTTTAGSYPTSFPSMLARTMCSHLMHTYMRSLLSCSETAVSWNLEWCLVLTILQYSGGGHNFTHWGGCILHVST